MQNNFFEKHLTPLVFGTLVLSALCFALAEQHSVAAAQLVICAAVYAVCMKLIG